MYFYMYIKFSTKNYDKLINISMYLCLYVDAFINSFAPFNVISHNIIFWVFGVCVCMCVDVYGNNIKDIYFMKYI